jgi:hypothetical protein
MPFRLIPVFFEYSLETGLTTNRTEVNPGYDVVQFSPSGNLTWLQMKRYEADKNDIIVDFNGVAMNLTRMGRNR